MRFYQKEFGEKIGIALAVVLLLGATISTMTSPPAEPDDLDFGPSGRRGSNEKSGRVRRKALFPPRKRKLEMSTSTSGVTQSEASTSERTADEYEGEESADVWRNVTTTTTTTTTTEAWRILKTGVSKKTTSQGTTEIPAEQEGTTETPAGRENTTEVPVLQEESLKKDSPWKMPLWVALVILMGVVVLLLLVILAIVSTACAVNANRLRGIRHHLGNVGAEINSIVNQDLFWHLRAVAPEERGRFRSQRCGHGISLRSYRASSSLNEMTPGATAFVPTHTATISKRAGRVYQERAKALSLESFQSVVNSESTMSEVRLSDPTTEL